MESFKENIAHLSIIEQTHLFEWGNRHVYGSAKALSASHLAASYALQSTEFPDADNPQ